MAMRVTGMYSGLDTESIISELVSAKQTKVDDTKKEQTKLEWKQDKWKELNTKIKGLQTKYLSNMRFAASYAKKTTKVSDSSVASVITGDSAVNGVQELQIGKLAKTAYLTGAKLEREDGETATALTKLSELKGGSSFAGGKITFTKNGKTEELEFDSEATISDVLTKLKEQGVNANFDEKTQRFFVSAKESGAASDFTLGGDEGLLASLGLSAASGASKIDGRDAEITLNGAKFNSSTNVFEINGLTITAMQETEPGKSVTVTTANDTEGIYDMIKNFFKEYNSVINEMDKLYNAESAKGYEPLTDDEKYAMSEKEVEDWEEKIKSSLLRRDSNLSSISASFKQIMLAGVEVNGKKMYLSDFGINTMGYFEAEDNERNAYHIDGDPDDANVSGNADKLGAMIAKDPDTVVSFFVGLSRNLYAEMDEMSKAVKDYRSYGNFYDDKKMKSDYDSYTSKIADLEEKLTAYEDQLYAKFGAMETALAKMQSNSSAVTSLLGG